MSTVKINVTVASRTPLAILVNDGKRETWVPLSQVDEEIQEPGGMLGEFTTVAIVVQDWVAHEKGLTAAGGDELTVDMFGGQG